MAAIKIELSRSAPPFGVLDDLEVLTIVDRQGHPAGTRLPEWREGQSPLPHTIPPDSFTGPLNVPDCRRR